MRILYLYRIFKLVDQAVILELKTKEMFMPIHQVNYPLLKNNIFILMLLLKVLILNKAL
ncbi:unnamed protein product [Meloidogyne enterolobii]|uniref:Uncharacterized protein n=1 Tax=Meloidogyne enterolobii TaxID=390850 RepID=A0ACB0Y4N1_MELEN